MAYVWFLLICFVWGSSFILMKKASLAFTPFTIGAGRVIGGAVLLGLIWWWQGTRMNARLKWADALPGLFVVLAGYAWPYVVQPFLVSHHGSAFIGMTVSFVPLLTIIVSVPLLSVYPTPRQLLGVCGALVCIAALMLDGVQRSIPLLHLGLAATVPFNYAVANVMIRRWLGHVSPLALTCYAFTATCFVLVPLAAAVDGQHQPTPAQYGTAVFCLAVLGIAGTGLTTFLFNKLIREHGPLFAGMVTNLVPIGAVVWGWTDHERVTPLQLAALAGILASVAVVQYGAAAVPMPAPEREREAVGPAAEPLSTASLPADD